MIFKGFFMLYILWPRQESNLDLELRKLLYYPLYYEANYYLFYCFPAILQSLERW